MLGLPRCKGVGELSLAQRHQRAWDALLGMGATGPTKAFFTQLGLGLGFADLVVTLFNQELFRCNARCNDWLYSPPWHQVWQVNATSLGEASDSELKCTFNFWKPLHTIIKWNLIDP